MDPGEQYLDNIVDLHEHIDDKNYIESTEHFESRYENPIDLPGPYYPQCILLHFKEKRFAKRQC